MKRTCGTCGKEFETRTSRAKSCSATCRSRAHRAGKSMPRLAAVPSIPAATSESGVLAVVTAALESAGRVGTPAGQVCLVLARQIEAGAESSTGLVALSKELMARIDQALVGATDAGDIVDELRAKRAARGAV